MQGRFKMSETAACPLLNSGAVSSLIYVIKKKIASLGAKCERDARASAGSRGCETDPGVPPRLGSGLIPVLTDDTFNKHITRLNCKSNWFNVTPG